MSKIFEVSCCARCPHKSWAIQDPDGRSFCYFNDDEPVDDFLEFGQPDWCQLDDYVGDT